MKKFLQFFSFAAMTQVILLLNQVILLPMQIRLWGTAETALWYAAIALATVTTVADCGLRTAGHVELLKLVRENDADAAAAFRQVWMWIRLLVVLVTATLLLGDWIYGFVHQGSHGMGSWQAGRALLTLAYALETVLIIRIVYLDSLGEYSRAESSYFSFAAIRLALAVPALLVLRVQPVTLCWLFLGTSVIGLSLQGSLCNIPAELHLFARGPQKLSWQTVSLLRYTMAEPCANWVRLSLPVLVIASIAPASAVTTFVALRAIYGAARTTIQQVARVASVEVLRFRAAGQKATAESLLSLFMLLAALIGAGVAGIVAVDNLRLLSLWLKHFDLLLFQNINLSFGLSGPFYSYQVLVALSFRIGQLAVLARRQYAYLLYSSAFAAVAMATRSLTAYLVLLAIAEIALSVSFMGRRYVGEGKGFATWAGWKGIAGSSAGTLLVGVLWLTVRLSTTVTFTRISLSGGLQGLVLLAGSLGVLLFAGLAMNAGVLRNLRNSFSRRPIVLAPEFGQGS